MLPSREKSQSASISPRPEFARRPPLARRIAVRDETRVAARGDELQRGKPAGVGVGAYARAEMSGDMVPKGVDLIVGWHG